MDRFATKGLGGLAASSVAFPSENAATVRVQLDVIFERLSTMTVRASNIANGIAGHQPTPTPPAGGLGGAKAAQIEFTPPLQTRLSDIHLLLSQIDNELARAETALG